MQTLAFGGKRETADEIDEIDKGNVMEKDAHTLQDMISHADDCKKSTVYDFHGIKYQTRTEKYKVGEKYDDGVFDKHRCLTRDEVTEENSVNMQGDFATQELYGTDSEDMHVAGDAQPLVNGATVSTTLSFHKEDTAEVATETQPPLTRVDDKQIWLDPHEGSGSSDEEVYSIWCRRSPTTPPCAQHWDHSVQVTDRKGCTYRFVVDQHMDVGDLKKFINRFLGERDFRVVSNGDVLARSQSLHEIHAVDVCDVLTAGGRRGQQPRDADHPRGPPPQPAGPDADGLYTLAFVMTECQYEYKINDAEVHSGLDLKHILANKTHIGRKRLRLSIHDAEISDSDLLFMKGHVSIQVKVLPPREDRERRIKRPRLNLEEQEQQEWMAIETMEDDQLMHEMQRTSLQPGMVPEDMIERSPIFLAWGGAGKAYDEEMLGKAIQKAKDAKTQFQTKQIRCMLITDPKCIAKINLANDAQVTKQIVTAAGKRLGMQPMLESPTAAESSASSSSGSHKGQTRAKSVPPQRKEQKPNEKRDIASDPEIEFRLHPDLFSIPVQETVTPGDTAAVLVHSREALCKLYHRCQGQGNVIAVAADRWDDLLKPAPLTCRLVKTTMKSDNLGNKQKVDEICDVAAYLYVISGDAPQVKQFDPDIEVKNSKSTTLVSIELLQDHAPKDAMRLFDGVSPDIKKWSDYIRNHLKEHQIEILDTFAMRKRGISARAMARIYTTDKIKLLKLSGTINMFFTPSIQEREAASVTWLSRREAESPVEAMKILKQQKADLTLGIAIRYKTVEDSIVPIFGIRAQNEHIEELRQGIKKKMKYKYLITGAPAEWSQTEILDICRQMQWGVQLATTPPRVRQGTAICCAYADGHPPASSKVIKYESRRVTLSFKRPLPPSLMRSHDDQKDAEKEITWSQLLGQRSQKKSTEGILKKSGQSRSASVPRSFLQVVIAGENKENVKEHVHGKPANSDGESEAKRPRLNASQLAMPSAGSMATHSADQSMPTSPSMDPMTTISSQLAHIVQNLNALSMEVKVLKQDRDDMKDVVQQYMNDHKDWDGMEDEENEEDAQSSHSNDL